MWNPQSMLKRTRGPGWCVAALLGCNEQTPQQEVEVDAAPIADAVGLPVAPPACPGTTFEVNTHHDGPAIWDGEVFILATGSRYFPGGLEAWGTDGVRRWTLPFDGSIRGLWQQGGRTRLLGQDAERRTMAFELVGEPLGLLPLPWPEGVDGTQVLPVGEDGFWVVDYNQIHRVEAGEVALETERERLPGDERRAFFFNGAMDVGGELHLSGRFSPDVRVDLFWLATLDPTGQATVALAEPGFEPVGLAFDGDGQRWIAGTRIGEWPPRARQRPSLGGRLVGPNGVYDFDHPFACSSANNRGLGQLRPLPGGDWLATGYLCSSGDYGDIWLLRLAPDGTLRWQAALSLQNDDVLSGVAVADDGTILLSGKSRQCCYDTEGITTSWLFFVDPEGRCLNAVR